MKRNQAKKSKSPKYKYKIVFDTNLVYILDENNLADIFNPNIGNLKKFIAENKNTRNKVVICIPDLVVKERISQRLFEIKNNLSELKKCFLKMEKFDISFNKKISEKNYELKLEEEAKKIFKGKGIEKLTTAQIKQDSLIERSLKRIPPFKKHDDKKKSQGDKGLRDTLIWLSILEDAKKNPETNYILLTCDGDYYGVVPEFRTISKKEFEIFSDIPTLEAFLDKKLDLDLGLKNLYKKISQKIEKNEEKIKVKIYEKKYCYATAPEKPIFEEFDWHTFKINNVKKIKPHTFIVELVLSTIGTVELKANIYNTRINSNWNEYSDLRIKIPLIGHDTMNSFMNDYEMPVIFRINITYYDNKRDIEINSIQTDYPVVEKYSRQIIFNL